MSNQSQDHVADERAAFDEAYRSYSSHPDWSHSDAACDFHWAKLAGHIWRTARAAIPAGANRVDDIPTWQARLRLSPDVASFLQIDRAKDAEIADLRARRAAGAPAETPKPLTVQQITDIWNATEKEWLVAVKVALDPADAGNLTVHFVRAIERAIAAQPAPAPATMADCPECQGTGRVSSVALCQNCDESGIVPAPATDARFESIRDFLADYIGDNWPMRKLTLQDIENRLRAIPYAAMLSANSPREAG